MMILFYSFFVHLSKSDTYIFTHRTAKRLPKKYIPDILVLSGLWVYKRYNEEVRY